MINNRFTIMSVPGFVSAVRRDGVPVRRHASDLGESRVCLARLKLNLLTLSNVEELPADVVVPAFEHSPPAVPEPRDAFALWSFSPGGLPRTEELAFRRKEPRRCDDDAPPQ